MEALTLACSLNASSAALAMNGRNESLPASRASKSALTRVRSSATAGRSTSTTVVSWADACSDCSMRWAMIFRSPILLCLRPRSDGRGAAAFVAIVVVEADDGIDYCASPSGDCAGREGGLFSPILPSYLPVRSRLHGHRPVVA